MPRRATRRGIDAFPDPHHDHGACVASALVSAEAICAAQGERLTALRRQVLALVWRDHHPVGAYDLLAAMQAEAGRKVAPPTVYRALDFLRQMGLVHRVESLNAYVGCRAPGRPHDVQFMICRRCRTAVELDDRGVVASLDAAAAASGFAIEQRVVEVSGLCARCATPRDGSPAPASEG
jgi:Fur family zinc uptake transcriptional regulator